MKKQDFKNHSRYVPIWHFVIPLIMLALFTGSIINIAKSTSANLYSATLVLVIAVLFAGFYIYTRWFALRAQDRAIRAEENFRHFILTGKPLDYRLRLSQIIALRFAADDEMAALAKKAVEENLSSKQIKQSIKNWRPDHHRV